MASAWVDGTLRSEEDARIPVRNRGFASGDGCFETIRIHRGMPFRLAAHLVRLREGLEILRLASDSLREDLPAGARSLAEANRVEEGLLRITVTAADEDR